MRNNQEYLLSLERELKYRNYSPRTVSAYITCVRSFLQKIDKDPKKLEKDDIVDYILYLQNQNKAPKTINLYKESIKFFLHDIIKSQIDIDIKLSREPKKLPIVLTRNEIQSIIENIKNQKHRFIISLTYGSGLRVSDVINLRV